MADYKEIIGGLSTLFEKRCTKCLMLERVRGVTFDNGECNYCREDAFFISDADRKEYLEDFHETVESLKKHDGKYNCILAFSGGKDSAYLLHLLINEYGLRPLPVTVDTGFLNPIAIENIARLLKIFKVDHQYIRPDVELFKSIYRYYLTTKDMDQNILFENCNLCTAFMDIEMSFLAEDLGIPVIFSGISPDETRFLKDFFRSDQTIGYDLPKKEVLKGLDMREKEIKGMSTTIYDAVQRYKKVDKKIRILFPFHALPYDPNVVRAKLKEQKLINKNKSHPLVTNCTINWILIYSLIKKTGHNPYIWMISDLVRDNPKLRRSYLTMDRMANAAVHMNMFQNKDIDIVLKELRLNRHEVL